MRPPAGEESQGRTPSQPSSSAESSAGKLHGEIGFEIFNAGFLSVLKERLQATRAWVAMAQETGITEAAAAWKRAHSSAFHGAVLAYRRQCEAKGIDMDETVCKQRIFKAVSLARVAFGKLKY